jgi:hypothetical protein
MTSRTEYAQASSFLERCVLLSMCFHNYSAWEHHSPWYAVRLRPSALSCDKSNASCILSSRTQKPSRLVNGGANTRTSMTNPTINDSHSTDSSPLWLVDRNEAESLSCCSHEFHLAWKETSQKKEVIASPVGNTGSLLFFVLWTNRHRITNFFPRRQSTNYLPIGGCVHMAYMSQGLGSRFEQEFVLATVSRPVLVPTCLEHALRISAYCHWWRIQI